jgi:FkbM family methyltransferase
MSSNIQLIDMQHTVERHFSCMKTKALVNNISTSICVHNYRNDIYVSEAYRNNSSIWEEEQVSRMLQLLIRHPDLDFIDVGANIGTYSMYAAALGRFVLGIDCFRPNLLRLRRASQLANVSDRVVLVQNAIYRDSGRLLRLSINTMNVGGQGLYIVSNLNRTYLGNSSRWTRNPYIVTTIRFDDILPILLAYRVRAVLMKIDIEGSESFVVESGYRVFDTLNIPYVQMEWMHTVKYPERVRVVLNFFSQRHYLPMTDQCQPLKLTECSTWPIDVFWLKQNRSGFC